MPARRRRPIDGSLVLGRACPAQMRSILEHAQINRWSGTTIRRKVVRFPCIRQLEGRASDVPSRRERMPLRRQVQAARGAAPSLAGRLSPRPARAALPCRSNRQDRRKGSHCRDRQAPAGAFHPATAYIMTPRRRLGPRPERRRRSAKRPAVSPHKPPPGSQRRMFGAAMSSSESLGRAAAGWNRHTPMHGNIYAIL